MELTQNKPNENFSADIQSSFASSTSSSSTSRSSVGTIAQDEEILNDLNGMDHSNKGGKSGSQGAACGCQTSCNCANCQCVSRSNDHDHAGGPPLDPSLRASKELVAASRGLNMSKVQFENSLRDNLGARGDIMRPGGGRNTIISSGDSDIIWGNSRGAFNTVTTGTGKDTIVIGRNATNRIFDFDPANDRLALASGIDPKNIAIVQGTNPGRAGLDQPLDSNNNALVIDKKTNRILASLTFTKAADLTENNFVILTGEGSRSLGTGGGLGVKNQRGSGQINGTQGRDRLIGGAGDDFLFVGDQGFKFNSARGIDEFPFPTDSKGTSELNINMKGGVLKIEGKYQDFDGLPLFSQGEREIDPNAKILNGANPQALVDGFLRVPQDKEGNKISGTHLHFSPAGDNRGNFADATVVRFFENTPIDAKSGTIKGEFELTPEEQAALLAGNLYVNIHTNIDGDGDGRAGFPTGENRINLNRDVVKFT